MVAQGTSGIWTYRKWNSGIAECWGTLSTTKTYYSGPHASFFYGYYGNVSLPITFTSAPSGTYTVKIGSGFAVPAMGISQTWDSSNNTISWYALGNVSTANTSVWVDFNIKGKWK